MVEDLEILLAQLADESRPMHAINLAHFSDLSREQARRFCARWIGLTPPRRLELVKTMVDQAEANIHLSFHAVLRECLTDADAQVRRVAVEGLWEDERTNLIPRLAALLAGDPVPEVRAAAAVSLGRFVLMGALGEIPEPVAYQAEQALLTAWYRPLEVTEVRRRALEGLASTPDLAVQDLIDNAYYDEDELMRQSAVFAMGRSADRRWARIVLAELHSEIPAMRFEAATSAGELSLKRAVDRLIELLDDTDGSVREAAALALGKIGGRAARGALEVALRGSDERLADAAEDALAELTFNSETLDVLDRDDEPEDDLLRHGPGAGDAIEDPADYVRSRLAAGVRDVAVPYEDDLLGNDEFFEDHEDDDLDWGEAGDAEAHDLDWDDEDEDADGWA
jgi:hypothetical protein